MPWKNVTAMEQKTEFINEWQSGLYTISDLCRTFEISRPTAYRLIKRFTNEGYNGLHEKKRKPRAHPNQTSPQVQQTILRLRKKHKHWGARKIRKLLEHDFPLDLIPSTVTVNNIMRRNGLISPRRKIHRIKPSFPIFDPQVCNETWSADYKGKFRMGNREYCHPLTVADSKSRFLFTAKAHPYERFELVKKELTRVFKEFGLPLQLHTDNGAPFASPRAMKRFSRLSYWLIDLGITPVFSDPGKPQQNGRHERMHRDLKAHATRPPAYNMQSQQRKLNQFVYEYNNIRPHDALDLNTPVSKHSASPRTFPDKIKEWEYIGPLTPNYVTMNGAMRWKADSWIYLSRALGGKFVGIEELGEGIWRVFYRNVFLGYFDENKLSMDHQIIKIENNIV